MGLDQAIEAEAQAQAICMQTQDFARAYEAFADKGSRCSRATDGRPSFLDWPFFDDAIARWPPSSRRWAGAILAP